MGPLLDGPEPRHFPEWHGTQGRVEDETRDVDLFSDSLDDAEEARTNRQTSGASELDGMRDVPAEPLAFDDPHITVIITRCRAVMLSGPALSRPFAK